MIAKLFPPNGDKNWSLQFVGAPLDGPERALIISQALHFGKCFHVSPFVQGDSEDWIMIEYWHTSETYILEAAMNTCKSLNLKLQLV